MTITPAGQRLRKGQTKQDRLREIKSETPETDGGTAWDDGRLNEIKVPHV